MAEAVSDCYSNILDKDPTVDKFTKLEFKGQDGSTLDTGNLANLNKIFKGTDNVDWPLPNNAFKELIDGGYKPFFLSTKVDNNYLMIGKNTNGQHKAYRYPTQGGDTPGFVENKTLDNVVAPLYVMLNVGYSEASGNSSSGNSSSANNIKLEPSVNYSNDASKKQFDITINMPKGNPFTVLRNYLVDKEVCHFVERSFFQDQFAPSRITGEQNDKTIPQTLGTNIKFGDKPQFNPHKLPNNVLHGEKSLNQVESSLYFAKRSLILPLIRIPLKAEFINEDIIPQHVAVFDPTKSSWFEGTPGTTGQRLYLKGLCNILFRIIGHSDSVYVKNTLSTDYRPKDSTTWNLDISPQNEYSLLPEQVIPKAGKSQVEAADINEAKRIMKEAKINGQKDHVPNYVYLSAIDQQCLDDDSQDYNYNNNNSRASSHIVYPFMYDGGKNIMLSLETACGKYQYDNENLRKRLRDNVEKFFNLEQTDDTGKKINTILGRTLVDYIIKAGLAQAFYTKEISSVPGINDNGKVKLYKKLGFMKDIVVGGEMPPLAKFFESPQEFKITLNLDKFKNLWGFKKIFEILQSSGSVLMGEDGVKISIEDGQKAIVRELISNMNEKMNKLLPVPGQSAGRRRSRRRSQKNNRRRSQKNNRRRSRRSLRRRSRK